MNNLEAWCSQDKLTMGLQMEILPQEGAKEKPWDLGSCILLWERKFKMTPLNFMKLSQNLLSDPVQQCWIGMLVIGGRGRRIVSSRLAWSSQQDPKTKKTPINQPLSHFYQLAFRTESLRGSKHSRLCIHLLPTAFKSNPKQEARKLITARSLHSSLVLTGMCDWNFTGVGLQPSLFGYNH